MRHRRSFHYVVSVLAIIAALVATEKVRAVEYTTVLLAPDGHFSHAQDVSGTQQVGMVKLPSSSPYYHAILWNSSAEGYVDLNPAGFTRTSAYDTSGSQQVGSGSGIATDGKGHALLWNGTPEDYVDLHPSDLDGSSAVAISGAQQVGTGYKQDWVNGHAILWNGTPESYIDLHPSGFVYSHGTDISGSQQVGYGPKPAATNLPHALLWNGSADSCVDLHPSGFQYSNANSTNGTQQGGWGIINIENESYTHALMWNSTAESYVDLNPDGFTESGIIGINDTQQVGFGANRAIGGESHALLWSGTPESAFDLHQFLPEEYVSSTARGIDSYGNIVGSAQTADRNQHAFLWQVVKPPILEVTLDIKPGNEQNPVNLGANGVLKVAVMGSDEMDVTEIDLSSLMLEGAAALSRGNSGNIGTFEDIDDDSFLDLVLFFDVAELGVEFDAAELTLTGLFGAGLELTGTDLIRAVPGGDADLDGDIDLDDLNAWKGNLFGKANWAGGDFDGDGDADVDDLNLWKASRFTTYDLGGEIATAVPEPATLSLLALGGMTLLRRKK